MSSINQQNYSNYKVVFMIDQHEFRSAGIMKIIA